VVLFLICPLKTVFCGQKADPLAGITGDELIIRDPPLYIFTSFAMLCWIVIAGGAVTYLVEGLKCTGVVAYKNTITNYLDVAGGGVGLLLLCLIIALIAQR
jgi:hypothetical protein